MKYNVDGIAEQYKAHLVAKGYTQQECINFIETFSPVVNMVTVQTILSIEVAHRWHMHRMDVSNVFLQGDLHDEVYMDIPQ